MIGPFPRPDADELPRDPSERPAMDTRPPDPSAPRPAVTICLPTYNRAHRLTAAIESALAPDGDDFELVVCDNASTDATPAVLARYCDPRLRYLRYERLVSMYANHNRCFEAARAPWTFILHSDETVLADGFAELRRTVSTVGPEIVLLFPGNPKLAHLPARTALGLPLSLMSAFQEATVEPSGWCVRTDAIRSAGGFDEANLAADLAMVLLLAARGHQFFKLESETVVRDELAPDRALPHFQNSDAWYPSLARSYCTVLNAMPEEELVRLFREHAGGWRAARVVEVAATWYLAGCNRLAETVLNAYPRPHELRRARRYAHILGIRLFGPGLHQCLFNSYRRLRRSIRAAIKP